MTIPGASNARRGLPWLVVGGVLVAALSLRGPIVAPTPVLRDIEADLGVGSATVALLTTAPVLMFAVLTPLAAYVIRRSGPELALTIALGGVLVGTFVRALPGFGFMLAGMMVIGAAITVGNIVIPVVIRRDVPPDHVGLITAAYVAMLNVGSLITSLLTAPIASVLGWPTALVLWSAITIAGMVVWGAHLARERRRGRDPEARYSGEHAHRPGDGAADAARPATGSIELDPRTLTGPMPVVPRSTRSGSFLRRPIVWLLTATFACQAFMYYGFTTWLPVLSSDVLDLDPTASGALASLFQGAAVVGAFVVPLLTRFTPSWVPVLVIAGCWLALTIGAFAAPGLMPLWLVFGATAHAGGFVVVFTVLVQVARSDGEAAAMSALVQGGGYAVGALAGPVMGGLHESTGAWTLALGVLVVAAVLYGVLLMASYVAARSPRRA